MHTNLAEGMSKMYTKLTDTILPQLAISIKGDCDKSVAELRSECQQSAANLTDQFQQGLKKQRLTQMPSWNRCLPPYTAESTLWSTSLKGHSA